MTSSLFESVSCSIPVHLHPSRLASVPAGVAEQLNDLLLKWSDDLQGVVLSYSSLKLGGSTARIVEARPHLHFVVHAKLLLFKPAVGSLLTGQVHKIGHDHIGLLVHGVFNGVVRGKGMPSGLAYDVNTNSWQNVDESDETIYDPQRQGVGLGSQVTVRVTGFVHSHSYFSMRCQLVSTSEAEDDDAAMAEEAEEASRDEAEQAGSPPSDDDSDGDDSSSSSSNSGDSDDSDREEKKEQQVEHKPKKKKKKKRKQPEASSSDDSATSDDGHKAKKARTSKAKKEEKKKKKKKQKKGKRT